jgi:hypothetical protein
MKRRTLWFTCDPIAGNKRLRILRDTRERMGVLPAQQGEREHETHHDDDCCISADFAERMHSGSGRPRLPFRGARL